MISAIFTIFFIGIVIAMLFIAFVVFKPEYMTSPVSTIPSLEDSESDEPLNNSPTPPQTGGGETAAAGKNWSVIAITILLLAVIGRGGWWYFSAHSSGGLSPEERELISLGWKKSSVIILRGPSGKPVVKVRLPDAENKKVQFKKYRWTKSYIRKAGGTLKIFSSYPQVQDETLMGENSIALMSGPNPPPSVIWWRIIAD